MVSFRPRSEEHTSELQSLRHLVCRLLLEKKKAGAGPHAGVGGARKTHPHFRSRSASAHLRQRHRRPPDCRQDQQGRLAQVSFFFNDTATTEIYTLSLHDALPIWTGMPTCSPRCPCRSKPRSAESPC